MTGSVVTCPECAGARIPGHPAGWLVFKHAVACSLLRAEDGTKVADVDAARDVLGSRNWLWPKRDTAELLRYSVREPTATERVLLTAIGAPADLVADPRLETACRLRSPGVLQRRWELLETAGFSPDNPTP